MFIKYYVKKDYVEKLCSKNLIKFKHAISSYLFITQSKWSVLIQNINTVEFSSAV